MAELLGVLGLLAQGCLGRSLPIPPPGISTSDVTECPSSQCPHGGVIVRFTGTAAIDAQVIVEDTSPGAHGSDGVEVGALARAGSDGSWELSVGPVPDPATGAILAPQRGDSLNVYQVTPGPNGGASNSVYFQIPLH